MHSRSTMAANMRVQLLGELYVFVNDAQAPGISAPRLQSLLAYLVFHAPAPVPRTFLAGLLTPEQSEAAARRALSDALYRLKRALGDELLCADTETVAFADYGYTLDVRQFQALAASPELDARRRAVEFYRGDFLRDLDAEWMLAPRALLREQYLTLLEQLCAELTHAQQFTDALTYAHRWTLADPLNEQAHRAAMQLYARLGRYAAAFQQYEHLTQLLDAELDAEPLLDTRLLFQAIRAEYDSQHEAPVTRAAFVGRRRERALLLECVEAAQAGRGGIVLVEGESGIGKTRLLEALAEGARWRSATVVWGAGRELAGITPFAPLDQAFASAIAGSRIEQLRAQLDAPTLHVLSGFAPRLRPATGVAQDTLPALSVAIAQALVTLARINPLVLIFDDTQWADAGFWETLTELAPAVETQQLLVVLAYRSGELRANHVAWSALQALDRAHAPTQVTLEGFSAPECAELVRVWGGALDARAALELQQRTGGNPLFVSQVLAQPEARTATLAGLLQRWLARLPVSAYAALEAAAVLGREFTHGVWQAIAGAGVLHALPALLRARLVEEDAQGYHFQHDLTREHVYHAIPRARLRELHQRAAVALERENAEPSILAWHYAQAEQWTDAARYYREAGERAERIHAFSSAADSFTRALDLLSHAADDFNIKLERLTLLSHRQALLGILERVPQRRADVEEIERIALSVGDTASLLLALEARLSFYQQDLDERSLRENAERALGLARELDDRAMQARILFAFGNALGETLGRAVEAAVVIRNAVELAEAECDYALACRALTVLAFFQGMIGQCAAARTSALRALELIEAHTELGPWRAEALHELANIHFLRAEWEAAYKTERSVLDLSAQTQNARGVLAALWQLTRIATAMGQYKDALQFAKQRKGLFSQTGGKVDAGILFAEIFIQEGDLARAEKALGLDQPIEAAQGRFLQMNLVVKGKLLLAQNRPVQALVPLERAMRAWQNEMQTVELFPPLLHALAAQRCGLLEQARASLALAEHKRADSEVARFDILLHLVRYRAMGNPESLRAARAEIHRQAALFTDDTWRADFLQNVALHREIESLYQTHCAPDDTLRVVLARANAPLGKTLAAHERVEIEWTRDAPEDAAILKRDGKVALRRHRLRRLLAQAHAQGAAPTDADLARALGVDIRTIERDMQALRSSAPVRTRRRK